MSSLCTNCGNDTLSTDLIENRLVLLCSLCKAVIDPNTTENESTSYGDNFNDVRDDEGDYYDDEEENDDTHVSEVQSFKGVVAGQTLHLGSNSNEELSEGGKSGVVAKSSGDRDPLFHELSSASSVKPSEPVRTCKGCGGQNLIHDTINETEHLICSDCGYFVEEQELVSAHEFTAIAGSSVAYQWTRAPKPKFANDTPYIAKGKVSAINVIKDVSTGLSLRQELIDQAVKLFESVYDDKTLKKASSELKDTVGACCVYSVARDNNVQVTLKTLMRLHKTKRRKVFTRALNLLKSISKKPVQTLRVSSLTEHILAAGKFEIGLIHQIIKLVDVCERAYLTQGRDHENVVIGVAHFVWVSKNIAERKSVSLKKFCNQHNLPYSCVCLNLQKEMRSLFVTLASQLPYCLEPVKPNMVSYYIGDIIKYNHTVISHANKRCQRSESSASPLDGPDCLSRSSSSSNFLDSQTEQETLPFLAPPSALAKRPVVRDEKQYTLPAHIKPSDLDKEEIHENEFLDADISHYILSPEEVITKQALLKLKE